VRARATSRKSENIDFITALVIGANIDVQIGNQVIDPGSKRTLPELSGSPLCDRPKASLVRRGQNSNARDPWSWRLGPRQQIVAKSLNAAE